ncbi:hypothetical protein M404DRAFT_996496 [Pisolithus tinctorius Marx 270]|uniref:Uncharacterized protein n=1 Tax=Pisolithus tinctorius Marx 270 TaxID=870435 RepID=A0A0C3JKK0_PISTI|nr:hypothetical protein M404DRAFT_996496 [Pisolithus tinctorius Marx 270]
MINELSVTPKGLPLKEVAVDRQVPSGSPLPRSKSLGGCDSGLRSARASAVTSLNVIF